MDRHCIALNRQIMSLAAIWHMQIMTCFSTFLKKIIYFHTCFWIIFDFLKMSPILCKIFERFWMPKTGFLIFSQFIHYFFNNSRIFSNSNSGETITHMKKCPATFFVQNNHINSFRYIWNHFEPAWTRSRCGRETYVPLPLGEILAHLL